MTGISARSSTITWTSTPRQAGLLAAAGKGLPVIIMEPLRGGKLVNLLPKKAAERIDGAKNGWSRAELALRWLWNQKEVTCVLSGMNSVEMVEENCRIASEAAPLSFTEEDDALIEEVRALVNENIKVPCTGCGYCMPCPQGVDIPGAFRCYNEMYTEKKSTGRHEFTQVIALRKVPAYPSRCIGCGRCESHCPQHIPVIEKLKEAERELRPFPYRIAHGVMRWFLFRGRR